MQPAGRKLQVVAGSDPTPLPVPEPMSERPAPTRFRLLVAYWVTFVVLASYLSLRLTARFRSNQALERLLMERHKKNARRIQRAIVALQGLFIKIGQLISIMTNFLPPEFRQELEGLQDQVPPRPFADIEARLRDELGKPPAELFAEFQERPVAAASIGQVHAARLKTGERVAVKVQYPGIEHMVRDDLRALRRIFRIVSWFVPFQGLDGVYREIRSMVLAELDFRAEAENARRIAANFTARPEVIFPRSVDELTTTRVLTTYWEEGIKIGDTARLDKAGLDRRAVAELVVEAYCQQIFVDGVYHADPHPGNVLVRPTKGDQPQHIVFLDFGAVAEVSPQMREGMVQFLQGAIHRDTSRIVGAMKKMGFIPRGADDKVFDRVIDHFHQRFQDEIQLESFSLREVKFDPDKLFQNLADLRRMDISLRDLSSSFFIPKEWFLLERTVLLLLGLCTALDPDLNPMSVIRPYLERFVLGPDQDWSRFVLTTTKELALSAVALPGEMRRFLVNAQRGQIEVSFRDVDEAAHLIYRLGHQIILASLGVAAVVLAVIFEGREQLERAKWCWWAGGAAALWLAFSWWSARGWLKKRRRR